MLKKLDLTFCRNPDLYAKKRGPTELVSDLFSAGVLLLRPPPGVLQTNCVPAHAAFPGSTFPPRPDRWTNRPALPNRLGCRPCLASASASNRPLSQFFPLRCIALPDAGPSGGPCRGDGTFPCPFGRRSPDGGGVRAASEGFTANPPVPSCTGASRTVPAGAGSSLFRMAGENPLRRGPVN